MNKYVQGTILIAIAVAVVFLLSLNRGDQTIAVKDFQTCQEAGGSIVDGEPVTCVAPDGTVYEESEHMEPEVVIDVPQYGALVTSPLKITGKAKGNWFFEANIPVTLKDQNGKVLAQKGFQADADWMTADYVPFSGTLEFTTPATDFGVLIINKDNPSGLPQFDAAFAVPVRFK